MKIETELLTIDSLRCYLKIGKSSLYLLMKRDADFPSPVKIGERRMYHKMKINQWIYRQKKQLFTSAPQEIDLLDLTSARKFLNISYTTFRRLTREDKTFPAPFFIAGKKMFDKLDISNWLLIKNVM